MTSPRLWLTVTPNLTNTFSPMAHNSDDWEESVQVSKKCALAEVEKIASAKDADVYEMNFTITTSLTNYSSMRAVRTAMVENIKEILKYSEYSERRGFRTYSLLRPIVVKNRKYYEIKFQVLISSAIDWSLKRNITVSEDTLLTDISHALYIKFGKDVNVEPYAVTTH